MRQRKKINGVYGFSLIEVLVSVGVFVVVMLGVVTIFKNYVDATKTYIALGEEEDIRRYIRARLDCKITVEKESAACSTESFVNLHDKNSNKLIENAAAGRKFNDSLVKARCQEDEHGYNITATIKRPDESTEQNLLSIPIVCGKEGECGLEPGWGNVQTFPVNVPSGVTNKNALKELVIKKSQQCGLEPPPERCNIRRASGAPKRVARVGYLGNPARDVLDLATLKHVCNILGYQTYVSSHCRDSKNRCQSWSCSDDCSTYYQGGSWKGLKPFNNCYYQTWLATITCKDPIK